MDDAADERHFAACGVGDCLAFALRRAGSPNSAQRSGLVDIRPELIEHCQRVDTVDLARLVEREDLREVRLPTVPSDSVYDRKYELRGRANIPISSISRTASVSFEPVES